MNPFLSFLAQVKLQNFVLVIAKGFIYSDPKINLFIKDEANHDIIVAYDNDIAAVHSFIHRETDNFISDTIVGAATMLT